MNKGSEKKWWSVEAGKAGTVFREPSPGERHKPMQEDSCGKCNLTKPFQRERTVRVSAEPDNDNNWILSKNPEIDPKTCENSV